MVSPGWLNEREEALQESQEAHGLAAEADRTERGGVEPGVGEERGDGEAVAALVRDERAEAQRLGEGNEAVVASVGEEGADREGRQERTRVEERVDRECGFGERLCEPFALPGVRLRSGERRQEVEDLVTRARELRPELPLEIVVDRITGKYPAAAALVGETGEGMGDVVVVLESR